MVGLTGLHAALFPGLQGAHVAGLSREDQRTYAESATSFDFGHLSMNWIRWGALALLGALAVDFPHVEFGLPPEA